MSVSSYATPNCGPQGPFLGEVKFQASQKHAQIGGKCEDRNGGHQMYVLLPNPLPLMPLVYYQLEFCTKSSSSDVTMKKGSRGYDVDDMPVKLFGRSSPPVRSEDEREALQKPLRWFEMKREGLQPLGNQLPIIYYIP